MRLPDGFVPGMGVHKATAKGGLGEQLLKRMGWSEGKGLGKREDGMASAITVKKKEDQTGVGAGAHAALQWENKWWEDAYNSGAAKVKQDASSTSSDSDSDESTDTEVPSAKRQRLHRDGTLSSATAEERSIAAALAKDKWGRFGGREGKMARIRAQELAAAAALCPPAAAFDSIDEESRAASAKRRKLKTAGIDDSSAAGESGKGATEPGSSIGKKGSKLKATAVIIESGSVAISGKSSASVPMAILASSDGFEATPTTGWWGALRFVSSGCLAGMERTAEHTAKDRQVFSEATQEELYMAVHGAKTTGKKGVGKGIGGGTLGGAAWKGSRVTFDEAAAGGAASPTEDAARLSGLAEQLEGVKWKKITMATLKQAPRGSMSRKKLCRKVIAEVAAKFAIDPEMAELQQMFDARLDNSSKFIISGSIVQLVE